MPPVCSQHYCSSWLWARCIDFFTSFQLHLLTYILMVDSTQILAFQWEWTLVCLVQDLLYTWASCHCRILRDLTRIVQMCWPGGQVRTRTQSLLILHLVLFLLFSFMYHSDLHLHWRALLSIRLNHKKFLICACFWPYVSKACNHMLPLSLLSFQKTAFLDVTKCWSFGNFI